LQYILENKLSEFEKEIIYDRYGLIRNIRTLQDIATSSSLTRERVRQIESKALQKIKHILDLGYIEEELIDNISKLSGTITPLSSIHELSPTYKTSGIIKLFCAIYPNKIVLFKNKYIIEPLVVGKSKSKEMDKLIKEIRSTLHQQVGFVPIKDMAEHFNCPDYLIMQKGTLSNDGYIALKSNRKAYGKDLVYTLENFLRKALKPLSVAELSNLTGSKENIVRSALGRSKKAVNVGLSTYGLIEHGYTNKDTKGVIVEYLDETNAPLSIKEIFYHVKKLRTVTDSAIYAALYDDQVFQRIDSQRIVLRRWGYNDEYRTKSRKYSVKIQDAILSVLRNSKKPMNVNDITKSLRALYGNETSTSPSTIYNVLRKLKNTNQINKLGIERSGYYEIAR
jgi:Fe2+ or Zn2+ uptake regulation protein